MLQQSNQEEMRPLTQAYTYKPKTAAISKPGTQVNLLIANASRMHEQFKKTISSPENIEATFMEMSEPHEVVTSPQGQMFQGTISQDDEGVMSTNNLLDKYQNTVPLSLLSFRVRSQTKTHRSTIKNLKVKRTIERLSVPKAEYIPQDPYQYSDFRGLLSADFKEALINCYDQETLDKINQDHPADKNMLMSKSSNFHES